jgi:hypothetical protein
VAIPYQADFSFKLMFKNKGFVTDIGYNVYARARERIRIKSECDFSIDNRRFAIKGLEGVAAITYTVTNNEIAAGSLPSFTPINQSLIQIINQNGGKNIDFMLDAIEPLSAPVPTSPVDINLNYNTTNSNIVDAFKNGNNGSLVNSIPVADITPENGYIFVDVNSDIIPNIISCNDLDPNSAAQCSMLTHKVFAHINYSFDDYPYQPFIGIGGSAEFNGRKIHNALSQWFIWLKTGLDF